MVDNYTFVINQICQEKFFNEIIIAEISLLCFLTDNLVNLGLGFHEYINMVNMYTYIHYICV